MLHPTAGEPPVSRTSSDAVADCAVRFHSVLGAGQVAASPRRASPWAGGKHSAMGWTGMGRK